MLKTEDTKTEIRQWLKLAKTRKHLFVLVVEDLFDYTLFPIYALTKEELHDMMGRYDNTDEMYRVTEVYSLTGKYTAKEQIESMRAWYLN